MFAEAFAPRQEVPPFLPGLLFWRPKSPQKKFLFLPKKFAERLDFLSPCGFRREEPTKCLWVKMYENRT